MKKPFYTVTLTQEVAAKVHVIADNEDAARAYVEDLLACRKVREDLAEKGDVLDDSWEIVYVDPEDEEG